jgi:FtsH-binding integral membrane protein
MNFEDKDLPGLFQSADTASVKEQKKFFNGIFWYLTLLIVAALFAFFADDYPNPIFKIVSTVLFLLTLFIMIWLRVSRPDDIWYNGRAVAESVKTRSWRWMMRAEPYIDCNNIEIVRKHFVNDLKTILKQNESLIGKLGISASIEEPISEKMIEIRKLNLSDRFNFYRQERITNQAIWYTAKSKFNKKRAEMWFWTTVSLHALAILLLLYNIYDPNAKLPIEVIAVAASSVLTWLQSKKHNELSSSYSLTAHEIILIKSETNRIETEEDLSEYIMNCENAFSREHTQWFARKNE